MRKSYLKYFAALLLFGSNGIVASHIHLSSYHIVLLRTLIGSLLLLVLYLSTRQRFSFLRYKKDCLFICISGIAMGASWMFLYEAYAQIGVSISSLLYYCGPVIVMVLSPILFRERLTAVKLLGFAAVLCGIFLINGQAAATLNSWGIACGLLSAVTYSVMVMANKKSKHIVGMENSLIQLIISFVTVSVFVGIRNGGYAMRIASGEWVWIIVLGILNTGIGCYFTSRRLVICPYRPLPSADISNRFQPWCSPSFCLVKQCSRSRYSALCLLSAERCSESVSKQKGQLKKTSANPTRELKVVRDARNEQGEFTICGGNRNEKEHS